MQLESLILSQSERERQIPHDTVYVWNLKGGTNEDRRTDLRFRRGRGREQDGLGLGVSKCKLPHLEWMGNDILLQGTGNCVQSLGTEHDGEAMRSEWGTWLYSRS